MWKSFTIFTVVFVLVCGSVVLAQQPAEERRPLRGGIDLLGLPDVRRDLKFTEDQRGRIDAILRQTREELRGLPRDKRPDKMQGIYERAQSQIDTVLMADQKKRLYQIELQSQGIRGLIREDVANDLALTREQHKRILAIFQEEQQAIENLRRQSKDASQFKQKLRELRLQSNEKAFAILTAEQKSRAIGDRVQLPDERWKYSILQEYFKR